MVILTTRSTSSLKKLSASLFVPEAPPSRPRSPENQVLLDHIVTWRWRYFVVILCLCYAIPMALAFMDLPEWVLVLPPLFLLLFVLPRLALPWLAHAQLFARYSIACFLLGETAISSLLSVIDVFDRSADPVWRAFFIHAGLAVDTALLRPSQRTLMVGSVFVALLLSAVPRFRVSRIRLASLLLVFGVASVIVCLPSQLVLYGHNSGALFATFGPSLLGLLIGIGAIVWSLLALLLLVRERGWVYAPVSATADSPQIEYIKSAGTLATTALVVAFFGFNTCLTYAMNLNRFIGLRQAMALDLIADATSTDPILQKTIVQRTREIATPSDPFPGIARDVESFSAQPPALASLRTRPVWLDGFSATSPKLQTQGFLDSAPTGVLFNVTVKELDLTDAWVAHPVFVVPADLQVNHVLAQGGQCAADLDEKTTYFKVYRDCEKQINNQAVKFPLIDTELPLRYIVVASFIAIAGCIAVLSDRLKLILAAPPSTKVEPWILLDASTLIGRELANAWIFTLAATPWLLIAASCGIYALQVRMGGSVIRPLHDSVSSAIFVLGLIAAGILSIRLVQQLLLLRNIRNASQTSPLPS